MIKVNSEKELMSLLKIISEEAVIKTKKSLFESADPAHNAYASNLKASESFYGVSLSEQEEAEPADDGEADTEETTSDTEEAPVDDEAEEEVDAEQFGVSFDSVLKDINNLRAGRSTKDKEIKDELLTYYDRLDEDERKILHLFLRELSSILQGALEGEDALDPSDAPLYADIIMKGNEGEDVEEPEEEADEIPKPEKSKSKGSTEDNSPPIKVNEQQSLQEIRRKVQRLMKRV